MARTDVYQSPLVGRYASLEMQRIFSDDRKFSTWRRLWVALAKAEQILGLEVGGEVITDEQIAEMEAHVADINYDVAKAREKVVRHDVMAHVYAYGQQCPKAAGIVHLGATSCYVTDNTDLLNLYDALDLVIQKLLGVMKLLANFADEYKSLPILGSTHGQVASVVTVGKRATLWLQDFQLAFDVVMEAQCSIKMLGCRGATGTADTFMKLFDNDLEKVERLEWHINEALNRTQKDVFMVSGQTYPRILDVKILSALSMVATAAHKMATDIRLLQRSKEIEEPFEKEQIGSSAMAYKRNPMRSERICSLARYVIEQWGNTTATASVQWLERTLDDSANRRMCLPEAFLATDGVLKLCANVVDGLVVNKAIIKRHLTEELPFMAVEDMIMEAVKKGMSRQDAHERIRQHSMNAAYNVKQLGGDNDLVSRVADDPEIPLSLEEIQEMLDPQAMRGCCVYQVNAYLSEIQNQYLFMLKTDIDTKVEV